MEGKNNSFIRRVIIAFNKPYGVLSQFTPDCPGQSTLAEYGFPPGVYPVGRLDRDSEGLLLLSDEKGFTDKLLNPRNRHRRSYCAQVEGIPDEAALRKLREGGILIQGYKTARCEVEIMGNKPDFPPRNPPIRDRKNIPVSWIRLQLTEGKNRQVRRMTSAVGCPTLRLIRDSIGSCQLGNLPVGEWKELNEEEIKLLFSKIQ